MVDFLKVKVNRQSDSVVLQHLWNSIDDLVAYGVQPSKANVIERCNTAYGVEISDINKNLFLALKEGTLSRSVKNDVLSRIELKENKSQGDWYCFLCHKVGPDTRCRRCVTSFHESCNRDLSDQFHCHTCQSKSQFSVDFHKFQPNTQLRIIHRVVYAHKIKWNSLNIIGYIKDDSRNNFFIYKVINSIEMDRKMSLGKYFSSEKGRENFLFDLLLLRHNCAVIYGNEHEFSKTITGYIKHLNAEIENIYCENCFLLFSKASSPKLNLTQKQELFCTVCAVRHPIMWGLVPPNVFWPFKLINEDNERYFGIKFARSIHFNRQKIEAFSKDLSLDWSSYTLQTCDRPSTELLSAISLAEKYAQNLLESKKHTNSISSNSNSRSKKELKSKSKSGKFSKSFQKDMIPPKRKLGRPPKPKLGRPPSSTKRIIFNPIFDKKAFLDNLSSTESSSSSGSVYNSGIIIRNEKKRKRIKDVFISDNEKPKKACDAVIRNRQNKRKRKCVKNIQSRVSSDSDSNDNGGNYVDSNINRNKRTVDYRDRSSSSSVHSRGKSRYTSSVHKMEHLRNNEIYSSDDTVPQRVSTRSEIYSSSDSVSESEINEVLTTEDVTCKKMLTHRRSHSNFPTSSKYSAYSSSASQSYNCTPHEFSKDHSIGVYKEINSVPSNGKDLPINQSRNSNMETGLYCSSASPVNFSPISNIQQTNVAPVSMQSTPSSNYQPSCDEATYQSGANFNMKIVLKNRAFQMSSPLQLGINIDPKIRGKSQNESNSVATNCKIMLII